MKYIPAVDGLRAVAVLSVVLFHAGFPFLEGGYIGVDVFFVISGFLITKILMNEIEANGRIDFSRFYYRRARRLFPALIFTLITTAIIAFILFTPQHFQRFGGELFYSIFSLSNFFFWSESGYFDTASELKPLLHTWSLSVEEQFYLLWPGAIYITYRLGRNLAVLAGLVAIFATSLMLNFSFEDGSSAIASAFGSLAADTFRDGAATIYFLTPFRAFEFAIGAFLVWTPKARGLAAEAALAFGLCLIGYAIFSYDESTLFPSYNALAPCLGAALCIAGCNAPRIGVLLSNPASIFLGKISYSVYLAHWPIIVFAKYWLMRDFTYTEMAIASLSSLAIGYAMYRLIETRYRYEPKEQSRSAYGLKCTLGALAICLPAASLWASDGWQWRIPEPPAEISAQLKDSKQFHQDQYGGAGFSSNGWISGGATGVADIVVIGDSHAKQYAFGLASKLGQPRSLSIYLVSTSCLLLPDMTRITPGVDWDTLCPESLKQAMRVVERSPNAIVMIAERWDSQMAIAEILTSRSRLADLPVNERIAFSVSKIIELHNAISPRRLIVVGSVPETKIPDVAGCFSRPQFFSFDCGGRLTSPIESHASSKTNPSFYEALKGVEGILFLDPYDALCVEGSCRAISAGTILYSDGNHLSKSGSLFVISHFEEKILSLLNQNSLASK